MKFIDLTGMKFGMLTVVKRVNDYVSPNGNHMPQWLCVCDCGNETIVTSRNLRSGHTKSCGCFRINAPKQYLKKYNTYDLSGEYGVGYTSKGEKFYFDLEDYNIIKDYCWSIAKNGYIIANKLDNSGDRIYIHTLLLPDVKIIDHINHNKTDNRRRNLRCSDYSKNSMNGKMRKTNTSGVTGVYRNTKTEKWEARIGIDNKNKYLGLFDNFEDAVAARKKAEEKYFGEFSYDNSMKTASNFN